MDRFDTMTISGPSNESMVSPMTADSRPFDNYDLVIGEHDLIPIGQQNSTDGWTSCQAQMRCLWDGHSAAMQTSILQESTKETQGQDVLWDVDL